MNFTTIVYSLRVALLILVAPLLIDVLGQVL